MPVDNRSDDETKDEVRQPARGVELPNLGC